MAAFSLGYTDWGRVQPDMFRLKYPQCVVTCVRTAPEAKIAWVNNKLSPVDPRDRIPKPLYKRQIPDPRLLPPMQEHWIPPFERTPR